MTRYEAIQALTGYAGIGGADEQTCDVTFGANIVDFDEAMRLAVAALREQDILSECSGCRWKGVRHQKCSCCRRNAWLKDNYEVEV